MTAKTPKAQPRASRRPKRVLVADDEPGTVDVLTAVLSDAGYTVIGAPNGREALAQISKVRPDVVLLDLVMPVMDGAEVFNSLRSAEQLSQFYVVMMSGLPESMVRRRCRGCKAFLRKPFSLLELLQVVKEGFEQPPPSAEPNKRRR